MFESTLSNVIEIDINNERIHFYSVTPKDKKVVKYYAQSYRARPFDEEFYEKFAYILKSHREHNPNEPMQKVSLVLPDSVFLTDMVNIPTMQKRAMTGALEVAIQAIYKNIDEIRYNTFAVAQNKQYTTYALVGIRKSIINRLKTICSENHVSVANITFFANATVNGAYALVPKLKNDSFVLLDIREKSAFYSIVVKGRTLGFYSLPFGYSVLSDSKMISEDLLFDHSPAELIVLGAKAKARAKHLTIEEEIEDMANEDFSVDEERTDAEDIVDPEDSFETAYSSGIPKKIARKLPKSMLREEPSDREGFVYENFRTFLKWTLDFMANNETLVNLGDIDKVYVNMPQGNEFLYDMINADREEHKVSFLPLLEKQDDGISTQDLELIGGLYVNQYNKTNNF